MVYTAYTALGSPNLMPLPRNHITLLGSVSLTAIWNLIAYKTTCITMATSMTSWIKLTIELAMRPWTLLV